MADPTPRPPQGPAPRRPLGDGDPGLERSATDSGRMGDKAGAFDPTTAPVQGDAESSGQPTPREAVARMVQERQRTAERTGAAAQPGFARSEQPRAGATTGAPPRAGARSTSVGLRTSLIALVVLVVIGLLAGILFT